MALVYRGALIGCGFFARNHMEAWHRESRAKIIAVCDSIMPEPERWLRASVSIASTPMPPIC